MQRELPECPLSRSWGVDEEGEKERHRSGCTDLREPQGPPMLPLADHFIWRQTCPVCYLIWRTGGHVDAVQGWNVKFCPRQNLFPFSLRSKTFDYSLIINVHHCCGVVDWLCNWGVQCWRDTENVQSSSMLIVRQATAGSQVSCTFKLSGTPS